VNYTVVFKPDQVLGRQDNIKNFIRTRVNNVLSTMSITFHNETIPVNNSKMLDQLESQSEIVFKFVLMSSLFLIAI